MKIAIIVNYKPENECGVSVVAQDIAKEISKEHKVLYVCLGEKYKTKTVNKNLTYLKVPSVSVKQLDIPQLTPEVVKSLFKELDNFNPDVIHSQNLSFMDIVCMVWALKKNTPIVVTFHAIISDGVLGYVFPKTKDIKVVKLIKKPPSTTLVKQILKKVDLVIALNEFVKKSVLSIYPKIKIKTINNPRDIKFYNKLKTKSPSRKKVFVFLGSYISRKNQKYLLHVFKHLPKIYKLELYGNKKTGFYYVKKLKKIISENKITNVNINNHISQDNVGKVLEKADYFVSASLKEAQSLVIIEALASGTPVIGLENETISELVNKKKGLSLPKETTPTTFAKRLQEYVNKSESSYTETAINCRKGLGKFDIQNVVKKIVETYKETVDKKKETKESPSKIIEFVESAVPDQFKSLFEPVLPQIRKRKRKPWLARMLFGLAVLISLLATGIVKVITLGRKK